MEPSATLEIPRLRALARHAAPHLVEATLVPLALFYATLWVAGVWGALLIALAWSYAALVRRLVRRERVPGILALGSLLLTLRTAAAFASGSVYVYFLQPTLGAFLVGGAFLLSVPAGRPLAERLAADFCPFPDGFITRPYVRRFFARISLLWAGAYLVNASVSLWLLVSQPVSTYVIAKQALSMSVTCAAIALSTLWFIRSMRDNGVRVSFARRLTPATVAVSSAPGAIRATA